MDPFAPAGLPNGTLLGDYKILTTLAQGGFGITYIAFDTNLKRQVVLKECYPVGLCTRHPDTGRLIALPNIPEQLYHSALARLLKEARTLAKLQHERIVHVYDSFESQGSVFYVMEYIEGGSLKDRIEELTRNNKSLSPQQVQEWLLLLLEGLEYLHDKEIYHRDIKPANILLNEQERPILIDFGAAINRQENTATITQGEYSEAYASPEQITNKGEIGPWTDFYALAATFYQLITLTSVEPAHQRLMKDDLRPLSSLKFLSSWPQGLLSSLDKNLQLRPEERSQTASDWKKSLLEERPQQNPPQKGQKKKKSKLMGCLLLLFLGGVLAVLLLLFLLSLAPPPKKKEIAPILPWERDIFLPSSNSSKTPPSSPQTAPISEQQDTKALVQNIKEKKEAFYQKIFSYYKIQDLLEKDKKYEQEFSKLFSQYSLEIDQIKKEVEKEIFKLSTKQEFEDFKENNLDVKLYKQQEALSQKWSTIFNDYHKKYEAEVVQPSCNISNTLTSSYPVENLEEQAFLADMEHRLFQELSALSNSRFLKQDKIERKISTLTEELTSLFYEWAYKKTGMTKESWQNKGWGGNNGWRNNGWDNN